MYSLLIRGGMVIDGTGSQAFRADVAVRDGRIVEVGVHIDGQAAKIIEADGLVVAPGFIDIHTHTDATVFANPAVNSKILQGVTTDVTGNCGIGAFPVNPSRRELLTDYLKMHDFIIPPQGLEWRSFSEYAGQLRKLGPGLNIAPLVPHGALRIAAMGAEDREPSAQELAAMCRLLAESMKQGAWGYSSGLIYPPGSFANTGELVELARVLAQYGGIYTTHIRGESQTLMAAVEEAIEIGRRSGARVHVSHLKAIGGPNWGKGREALTRIEMARQEGVDVTADQYPYEASSTSLSALAPQWAHAGGVQELLQRLAAEGLKERLVESIGREMGVRGGPERVVIASVATEKNLKFAGRTVAQLAEAFNMPAEEAVIRLLLEENAQAVYFSISPQDVDAIMTSGLVAVGSDGRGLDAAKDFAESPHPRSYGTFPRVLGRFVRERGLITLEQAVYKMTALPAARLQLTDRGQVKPGMAADLTLFDPERVLDRADFTDPHRYPDGIPYVIVNGCVTVSDGLLTGDFAGKVLCKNLDH